MEYELRAKNNRINKVNKLQHFDNRTLIQKKYKSLIYRAII